MSNNIDTQSLQLLRPDAGTAGKRPEQGAAHGKASGQPIGADTVELTQAALTLKELEIAVANLPEVDAERVASIRARIDSGDYAPDSRRIAERMIAMDAQLPDVEADGE